jgi:hypothetical protein
MAASKKQNRPKSAQQLAQMIAAQLKAVKAFDLDCSFKLNVRMLSHVMAEDRLNRHRGVYGVGVMTVGLTVLIVLTPLTGLRLLRPKGQRGYWRYYDKLESRKDRLEQFLAFFLSDTQGVLQRQNLQRQSL